MNRPTPVPRNVALPPSAVMTMPVPWPAIVPFGRIVPTYVTVVVTLTPQSVPI
jgi:hypothetical protein